MRDRIECPYHGWQFDGGGICRSIPGLLTAPEKPGRGVPSFACRELHGFIWIFATPDTEPSREPFRFPHLEEPGYVTVRQSFDMKGTMHAVAENALDVPHTAFLHRGSFRGNRPPCEIEVVVRRWHDRVEAEYIGEPRPAGLVGKILAPSGGLVQHFDRFLLPSVAQVEYRLGEKNHLCISSALTPLDDFETRLFSTLTFRLRVPSRPLALVLRPLALRILKQDASPPSNRSDSPFRRRAVCFDGARCAGPAHPTPSPRRRAGKASGRLAGVDLSVSDEGMSQSQ